MSNVNFYKGLEANLPSNRDSETIYITTDSGKMWIGERRIGVALENGLSSSSIQQEGCISGGRAYRFSKVTYNSDGSGIFSLIDKDGNPLTSLEDAPYTLNQYYSYIINAGGKNAKQDFVGKITKVEIVDGTVCVYVSALGTVTSTIVVGKLAKDDPSECLFIAPQNPSIGDIEIGQGAITLGFNSTNLGTISFVSGEANLSTGHYALIGGKKNIGGYGSLIGGRDNFAVSNYSVAGGSNHTVTGLRSAAFNLKNTASHQNCTVVGSYNITKADNQLVGGTCANPSTTSLFTIGNGSSTGSRTNAFEVLKNGTAVANIIQTTSIKLNNVIVNAGNANRFWLQGNTVNGDYGVAFGAGTTANAGAFSTGSGTKATGYCSATFGNKTQATQSYQVSIGTFNKLNNEALFMVGNGTSDTKRSNAFEVISTSSKKAIKVGDTELTESNLSNIKALTTDMVYDYGRWNIDSSIGFNQKTYFTEGLQMPGGTLESFTDHGAYGIKLSSNDSDIGLGADARVTSMGNIEISSTYGSVSIISTTDPVAFNSNGIKIGTKSLTENGVDRLNTLYGDGLIVPSYYAKGTAAFGKFNSYVDYIEGMPTPEVVFMVGNGTGDGDTERSNAFEVISAPDKKAIKVGNAELPETSISTLNKWSNSIEKTDDGWNICNKSGGNSTIQLSEDDINLLSSNEAGNINLTSKNAVGVNAKTTTITAGKAEFTFTTAGMSIGKRGNPQILTADKISNLDKALEIVDVAKTQIKLGDHILTADKLKKILDFIDTIE